MNILLVDSTVEGYQVFVSSVNSNTMPIVYFPDTTRQELLASLSGTIERIAVVSHTNTFIEKESLFSVSNIELFRTIIEKHQVKHIDYLACNTLQNTEWIDYFGKLSCVIGASNDLTGNLKYGGDWIMESTAEDIEAIYFTESIKYYTYLLVITYINDPDNPDIQYKVDNNILIGVTPNDLSTYNLSSLSITSIATNVFKNFVNLSSITFPSTLITIQPMAFTGCINLAVVTMAYSITYYDDTFPSNTTIYEFEGKTLVSIIPNDSESYNLAGLDIDIIGEYVFQNFTLKSVTFPSNLTMIDNYSFKNCKNLEKVSFLSNLTRIGDSAFQNCTNLGEVTFPTTLTTIDNYAFQNSALTTVTIPSSTTFIGKYAFSCSTLRSVTIL